MEEVNELTAAEMINFNLMCGKLNEMFATARDAARREARKELSDAEFRGSLGVDGKLWPNGDLVAIEPRFSAADKKKYIDSKVAEAEEMLTCAIIKGSMANDMFGSWTENKN